MVWAATSLSRLCCTEITTRQAVGMAQKGANIGIRRCKSRRKKRDDLPMGGLHDKELTFTRDADILIDDAANTSEIIEQVKLK